MQYRGSCSAIAAAGCMDKYLAESTSTAGSRKRALPAGIGQRTLQQCKKTVILRGHTAMNFKIEHIYACKTILEERTSTPDDKLEQLRILSVMQVSQEHLRESKIGHLVRRLCKDADTNVARLAQRLLDKWKAQVLQDRSHKGTAKRRAPPSEQHVQKIEHSTDGA